MARKSIEPQADFAIVKLHHRAMTAERLAQLRGRGRKSVVIECRTAGHSWVEDEARHGGTICLVCEAVRWP